MSWSKILKNRSEVSSHILQNSKPFLHQIGTKSGFYMTAGDGHLKGWPRSSKALPKAPNLHKKDHGHCLVVCCQSDPLHHSEFQETIISEKYAQQIDEMHWKLQYLQPALVIRTGPILLHDNVRPYIARPMFQKLNELGYKVLPHPPYSSDLSPIDYHFLKHLDNFLQGKHFHNQ